MNGLRAEAEQILQNLTFEPGDNQYEAIQIKSLRTDYADTSFEDNTVNEAELRAFIDYSPSCSDTIFLKLVCMYYQPGLGIKSSLSLFRHVWHSFDLDPYMIYMFHRNVPGFHQLSSESPGNPLQKFYVNRQAYWLLWTYNPSTLSTNAALLCRNSRGGHAAFPGFHARLERYSALAGHPLFLALISALDGTAHIDNFLIEQHIRVGRTERHTGFSHFHLHEPRPQVQNAEAELAQLSYLSRSASSVLVGLADIVQHLRCSSTVVGAVLNSSLIGGMQRADVVVRSETEMKNIASILAPQLKERFEYVEYIRERARNQLSVIFNLLARGDAQANIDLAEAAMLNSTSMTTIAIMTMGFLPATFYAALFAVPSLQWDQPSVIGSRFWVYWAVTIPTTVLVFVIWFGMMHWRKLSGRIKEGMRELRRKVKRS